MTNWHPDITAFSSPRYAAIVEAMAADIAAGTLKPGDRLPPQRELAWRLGLTLGTVTRAYGEAERRGLVIGEVGRGTFVRPQESAPGWIMPHDYGRGDIVDMTFIVPPIEPDLGKVAGVMRQVGESPEMAAMLEYQGHMGRLDHRGFAAQWIGESGGLEVEPARVAITSGAHHGILCALATLTQPGDRLLVEPFSYPGIQAIAGFLHLRLEPVEIDEEGMIPEALAQAADLHHAKVAYIVPTLQNPTTATMSAKRREAIARVLREKNLTALDDDLFGLLPEERLAPLTSYAPESCFYITSLSKTLAPGLRAGFVAVPPGKEEAMNRAIRATCWMSPPLTVEVAKRLVEVGEDKRAFQASRREAAIRRELLFKHLGEWKPLCPRGSIHAWLPLPENRDSRQLCAALLEAGVRLSPADTFAVGRRPPQEGLRICFGAPKSRAEVERGLEITAQVLARRPNHGIESIM